MKAVCKEFYLTLNVNYWSIKTFYTNKIYEIIYIYIYMFLSILYTLWYI